MANPPAGDAAPDPFPPPGVEVPVGPGVVGAPTADRPTPARPAGPEVSRVVNQAAEPADPAAFRPPATGEVASFPASGLRPLDPKQVQVWRVGYGLTAAVFVLVVLGADAVIRLADGVDLPWLSGFPAAVLALLLGLLVWRMPRLAYDRWRYELAEETLELHRGVIVHAHTAIPYFRVQHIDITRSPVERALGLSQLVVRTAAATTDATIPGVAASEAETLRDVILARTGRDDAV